MEEELEWFMSSASQGVSGNAHGMMEDAGLDASSPSGQSQHQPEQLSQRVQGQQQTSTLPTNGIGSVQTAMQHHQTRQPQRSHPNPPNFNDHNHTNSSRPMMANQQHRSSQQTQAQGQARPPNYNHHQQQARSTGTLISRPRTPQYQQTAAAAPQYYQMEDEYGQIQYFQNISGRLVPIDPMAHGIFSPPTQRQARSSPAGPPIYQPDPSSSSSLHSRAVFNAIRARNLPTTHQMSSQSFHMDDEEIYDQLDQGIDWDVLDSQQPLAQATHGYASQQSQQRFLGRASPQYFGGIRNENPNAHVALLERQCAAERHRSNVLAEQLSRMSQRRPILQNQSSDPTLNVDTSLMEVISSPSVLQQHQQQQRQVFPSGSQQQMNANDQRQNQGSNATAGGSRSNVTNWGLAVDGIEGEVRKSAFVAPLTKADNIPILPRSILPDIFGGIFPFTKFNMVQSACYPIIMQTDENIVVTAPTGAGKTVLFELAMIRLWQKEKEGQVVYIAPTKSLCTERANDWNAKFSKMRQKCVELTGDTQEGALAMAKNARVIVTTPEKWDSVTRNLRGGTPWYDGVKVFCIDEVHLLAEERGATLEVIVSRMKAVNPEIRFVAVSATVPNIEDVAVWLGPGRASNRPVSKDADGAPLPPMARVMKFGDEFRPVPLQKYVHGYPKGQKNDQQFDASLNYKLLELIERYASRKPVLVFCNTRKGCTNAARQLLKDYNAHCQKRSSVPPWPNPTRVRESFQDTSLAELAAAGIGTHHAGMDFRDRRLTESLFLKQPHQLHVICTTSTLAVGINLPARMVIVKNTKIWDGSKFSDYSDLDILQMMGRAGRPQFDDHGVAVIMCQQDEKDKYERMAKSQTILESCLHKSLVEYINSEIATKTIKKVKDAYTWLQGTFLYVRIRANPQHYQAEVMNLLAEDEDDSDMEDVFAPPKNPVNPEKRLKEMVVDAIARLKQEGLVEETDDGELETTSYGDMLCSYSIRFGTFLSLKNMDPGATPPQLLAAMCKAIEFKDLKFRSGEKSDYADLALSEEVLWEVKPNDYSDKVNILVQLQLGGRNSYTIKIKNGNPAGECMMVMQHIRRIASCVVDLATHKKDAVMSQSALQLARCLKGGCWESTFAVLTQLEGIGVAMARSLKGIGINSFEDLKKAKSYNIDAALSKKSPFGKKLIEAAERMPDYAVSMSSASETIRTDGVKVTCEIKLSLKNRNAVTLTTKKGLRKLTTSILLVTSDKQWIEYKRMKVATLHEGDEGGGITLKKSVVLTKPSQKIECYISCDEIAGLTASAELTPTTPAHKYPVPAFDELDEDNEENGANKNDAESDGEEVVRTKAVVKKSAKTKPTETGAVGAKDPDKLANGNYKCRHACQGACKHQCCEVGLAKKPKEPKTPRITKDRLTNMLSDSEDDLTKAAARKPVKKAVKRSAQEIANSMKGASNLTATSIKLDRLPRSLRQETDKLQIFPWNQAEDSDDTDTLPEVGQALLRKTKTAGERKHQRDPSPDVDVQLPSPKRARALSPVEEATNAYLEAFRAPPRTRSLTMQAESPKAPLSPTRFTSRIIASSTPPGSPSPPKAREAVVPPKKSGIVKQPLFRPPSKDKAKRKIGARSGFIDDQADASDSDEEDGTDDDEGGAEADGGPDTPEEDRSVESDELDDDESSEGDDKEADVVD